MSDPEDIRVTARLYEFRIPKPSRKDAQWLEFCESSAKIFSTCIKAQVFAVIVDSEQRIVGTGYNGVPSGLEHCVDGGCPRGKSNVPSGSDYDSGPGLCYAAHAEANALAHGDGTRYSRSTLYVNKYPCLGCARLIASSGIKRIVTDTSKEIQNSSEFLAMCKIEVVGV